MPGNPRFGARLHELRQAQGLSLRGLARQVPCAHVHIRDIELGNKSPSQQLAARLDHILEADGDLVMLAAGADAPQASPWEPMASGFGRRDAEDLADALTAGAAPAGDPLRMAHLWLLAEPPQVLELRAGRRVGAAMVAKVRARVDELRRLDDHVGGRSLYDAVTAEVAATAGLLREASYTEQVGRGLLVALGELAQLAGWVASDAGLYRRAEAYYLAGARAAHAGGDTAGAANCLSSLAYQMANVGRSEDAVVLARTAAEKVRHRRGRTRALMWERAAWAHARAADPTACERALGEVEQAGIDPAADDPAWVYWLDSDEADIMAGRCWTELGRPLRAVPILYRATAGYAADRAREASLYLSWLAEALIQARELDEAATVALRALELARGSDSARAVERVGLLRRLFRPSQAVPAVAAFEDAYRADLW